MSDNRMKVRHPDGRIGAVERVLTSDYCSVQFRRDGYYEVCKIDDLIPIDEDEFRRKFR